MVSKHFPLKALRFDGERYETPLSSSQSPSLVTVIEYHAVHCHKGATWAVPECPRDFSRMKTDEQCERSTLGLPSKGKSRGLSFSIPTHRAKWFERVILCPLAGYISVFVLQTPSSLALNICARSSQTAHSDYLGGFTILISEPHLALNLDFQGAAQLLISQFNVFIINYLLSTEGMAPNN